MIIKAFSGLLRRIERVAPSHTQHPVPMEESVPAHRVAIVCVGIAFTLTGLYMGSEIALELGWRRGVMAAVVGSIILAVMSIPAAIVGARTRLSTYMIVRHVFGEAGSRVVNAVLALVLIGWYAVTAELFGRTCYLTLHQYFPHSPIPMGVFTVGCSLLVVATTVFGFRALERLSLVVAPMLVALTLYVALQAVVRVPWQTIASSAGTAPDLGRGISAVGGRHDRQCGPDAGLDSLFKVSARLCRHQCDRQRYRQWCHGGARHGAGAGLRRNRPDEVPGTARPGSGGDSRSSCCRPGPSTP